ncbi:MAG: TetR/AcrR family transcriptional regulator [Candidatus Protistobacter heckmanni]|nr:TetR/AcrR family transcriptional regulator [Candidatus Protistobacter heckmanni]
MASRPVPAASVQPPGAQPVDLSALPARDRILHAAHDLFYAEGIRATGVDRVIAESGVAKLTFYRHFPSKNDLILAFLGFRNERWIAWFSDALRRHGGSLKAMVPSLREWFDAGSYRGFAFINAVSELGTNMPEAVEISRSHKRDMEVLIANLLPASRRRGADAKAIAVAVDGAIIRAQMDRGPDAALKALAELLKGFAPRAAA